MENPKVFISYSHGSSEYENKVLEFSNRLRANGIDANVDLYEEAPAEGWPRWMETQIRNADFVLVINSQSYYEKCYSDSMRSKGISWEVNIVYQFVYDSLALNTKFIPVFFDQEDEQYILTPLKPFTFYNIGSEEGFSKLYSRLLSIPKTVKPPLGTLKPLPEKERKTMFFSTPIDLDKWNNAKWKGMLYLFIPGKPPTLGLIYQNYQAGKAIFENWKKYFPNDSADEYIKVDFIVPPFPTGLWIHESKDHNCGKGYFVHIGPNIDEAINRAVCSGIKPEEMLLTMVSRYQWMDEISGSQNRNFFMNLIKAGSSFFLMPIGIKDNKRPIEESNIIIDFTYAIKMRNVSFTDGICIKNDNICKIVLNK